MKDHQKEFIREILQRDLDEITATYMHLEHQLSLPPEHRVTDADDEKLDEDLKQMKSIGLKYELALEALKNE